MTTATHGDESAAALFASTRSVSSGGGSQPMFFCVAVLDRDANSATAQVPAFGVATC